MENTLGEQLKKYRKIKFPELGLRKVAEIVDVSFAHLNKLERGLPPSDQTIYKLAEAYELSQEEKFELLKLADIAHKDPNVKKFFDDNPEKLKDIYFRKSK